MDGCRLSIIVLLLFLLNWNNIPTHSTETSDCDDVVLGCPCGSVYSIVDVKVERCYNGEGACAFCYYFDEQHACQNFSQCETCLRGLNHCYTCPAGSHGNFCTEGRLEPRSIYPIFYDSRLTREMTPFKRVIRQSSNLESLSPPHCPIPTTLEHADYRCWQWDGYQECDLHCHHGYTLRDQQGPKRYINCSTEDGNWKPARFEDCQPYYSCNFSLISPGHYFCKYAMEQPTFCEIRCGETDAYEKMDRTNFVCDEHWDPKLPFCVRKNMLTTELPPG